MQKPKATLDPARLGISTFDAEHRLVTCNAIYRQIYNLPERLAVPGTRLGEIVGYFLEKEAGVAHPDALNEANSWSARHVEQLALAKSSAHIHFLSDGRIILVRNEPAPEGGWRETHEDITDKCRADAQLLHLGRQSGPSTNRTAIDERLRSALA